MKKSKILIIIIIIVLIIGASIGVYSYIDHQNELKEDATAVTFKDNLQVEFLKEVKISDFIENLQGELIDDYKIDTTSLGTKQITFEYKSIRNKTKTKSFNINIVDTEKPKIYLSDSMTVKKGYNKNLKDVILSGDNCDSEPERLIEGDYDINKIGSYKLKYIIKDASGNQATKDFTLNVVGNSNSSSTTTKSQVQFSDAIKNYKTESTKLGIDVSKWQGEINWEKVKDAGVEFVMIRIGYQNGYDGANEVDPYFEKNVKAAINQGIKVGLYFNSYAKTIEEVEEQAKFVIEKSKEYKIELPVSFDWENWTSFSTCKMSFYDLNNLAHTFEKILEKAGYSFSLYSSKNYLETIWYANQFENIWLANYTSKTTYSGKYQMWQLCNTGKVNGINGDVDIDVLYEF